MIVIQNLSGSIQPIDGATFKVESFFEIFKINGLSEKQGVIIPHHNIKNLALWDKEWYIFSCDCKLKGI